MYHFPADRTAGRRPPWQARPAWWSTADERDRQAAEAAEDAEAQDGAAASRDEHAAARDQAAADRDSDAATWMAVAQRRLIHSDSQDAQRWADSIAAVEAARASCRERPTAENRIGLIQAEAECEAETKQIIRSGLERQAAREDLARAAQHLAAGAQDRNAAASDRARSQADRHAAARDRATALVNRQQSAIDRSRDPDIPPPSDW